MAGMGPAPKHPSARARRNAAPGMTTLPAAGRTGDVPAWPLRPDVVQQVKHRLAGEAAERLRNDLNACEDRRKIAKLQRDLDTAIREETVLDAQIAQSELLEAELWSELWSTPQSIQWEKLGWIRDVAQYVRWKVRAEMGDLDSGKEARQWSDRLGLSPLAMLRLRWEIGEPADPAQSAPAKKTAARKRAPKKDDPRLVLVQT